MMSRQTTATTSVVALVAIPGFATAKALLVICYLIHRAVHGTFGIAGLFVGASVLSSLAIASCIGSEYVGDLDQLSRLLIFFSIFACAYYLRGSFRTADAMDALCRNAAIVAAGAKIAIIVAVVGLDVSFEQVQTWLGFESVTQPIGFGLQRLQFPSDFVILFLVGCYSGGKSRRADLVFAVAVSIVVMLSFSRFIFGCFFVGVLIRAIWLSRFDLIPKFTLGLAIVLALVFADSLLERFSGESAELSDDIRVEQVEKLSAQAEIRPLFGHGLGASVPGYERSESQPYTYEMQWYSTLMQLGWIGLLWFLANLAAIVFRSIRSVRAFVCVSLLVALWAASGFTNPFLTSLGSAVGLSIAIWRSQIAMSTPSSRRNGRASTYVGADPAK